MDLPIAQFAAQSGVRAGRRPSVGRLALLATAAACTASAAIASDAAPVERAMCDAPRAPAASNVLSSAEKRSGWSLLWDGRTSAGWRSVGSESFPANGWTMCNGVLAINGKGGDESRGPGDIITKKRFGEFDLQFAFQITPGANSGLKTFVQTDISPVDKVTGKPTPIGSGIGLEFQVLDDAVHPDAKLGRDGNRTVGSLYDLISARKDKRILPPGQWNRGRVVSRGRHLTFYLNGHKTVDVDRGSATFGGAVAQSKFKNITGFGEWIDGHLLLQDHGDRVFFTDLKVRDLTVKN